MSQIKPVTSALRRTLLSDGVLILSTLVMLAGTVYFARLAQVSLTTSVWVATLLMCAPLITAVIFACVSTLGYGKHIVFVSLVVLGVYFCAAAGTTALPATVIYFVCCVSMGMWVLGGRSPLNHSHSRTSLWSYLIICFLIGAAFLATGLSLVLGLTVHSALTYNIIALVAIFTSYKRWMALGNELTHAFASIRYFNPTPLLAAAWGMLLCVVAVLLFSAALPIGVFDDISYHLALPSELLNHFRYGFEFKRSIWAVAPWNADLLFGYVYVLSKGGDGAKSWINVLYLATSAWLFYDLVSTQLKRNLAAQESNLNSSLSSHSSRQTLGVFLTALLFSTPIMMHVYNSLQTEPTTLLLVLGAVWIWMHRGSLTPLRGFVAFYIVLGLIGSIKASNLVFASGLALLSFGWIAEFSAYKTKTDQHQTASALYLSHSIMGIGLALVLSAFICLLPYGVAWIKTGNPVFPLFNLYFKSPYFLIENFANGRYATHFNLRLMWDLWINTPQFMEAGEKLSGGLQFVLALPALMYCVLTKQRAVSIVALIAAGVSLFLLAQQQYLRYIVPLLPLLLLPMMYMVGGNARMHAVTKSVFVGLLIILMGINFYYMPRFTHLTQAISPVELLSPNAHEKYLEKVAPIRLFNATINKSFGQQARVLYMVLSMGADLQGKASLFSFYSPHVMESFAQAKDPNKLREFITKYRITHIITISPSDPPEAWYQIANEHMAAYLKTNSVLVQQIGNQSLYKLSDQAIWSDPLLKLEAVEISQSQAISKDFDVQNIRSYKLEVERQCSWTTSPDESIAIELRYDLNDGKNIYDARTISCRTASSNSAYYVDLPPNAQRMWVTLRGSSAQLLKLPLVSVSGALKDAI